MINNRQITISVGASRKAANWQRQVLTISELYERLRTPARGAETQAEYLSMSKAQQDERKDVGGFVAGALNGPRRKAGAVVGRDVLTLDLDNIRAGGTQDVLCRVEGLLSEVEAAERTATEITSSAGDYNLSIIEFQSMFEDAAKEAVRLCGTLGRLYHIPDAHEVDLDAVSIDWGNGILFDEEKTWTEYLDMVARGLLKPEIALGWRFGMPTETEADLAAIRAKYMPELQQLADGDV